MHNSRNFLFALPLVGMVVLLGAIVVLTGFGIRKPVSPQYKKDNVVDERPTIPRGDQVSQMRHLIPPRAPREQYVTSDACVECHADEHASWHRTYHRTMTQVASADSILAPFAGTTHTAYGQPFSFERKGDDCFVRMIDPDWQVKMIEQGVDTWNFKDPPMSLRRVVMTTGSRNAQYYWVEGRNDREPIRIPVAYIIREDRLVPLHDAFLQHPSRDEDEDLYYWDHRFGFWNRECSMCHSVGAKPGLDLSSQSLRTEVAEFGISCESCHGPGKAHVQFHRDPTGSTIDTADQAAMFHPLAATHEQSTHMCGRCHNEVSPLDVKQYAIHGLQFQPGDKLEDFLKVSYFTDGDDSMANTYWPDATQRVAGNEFLGTATSPCYLQGEMSCLSCHSMHNSDPKDMLAERMETNDGCLQCHSTMRDDISSHTHHAADSSGSQCYNCHMPHTAYGFLAAQRTHKIGSPQLDGTFRRTKPNACNLCHLDETLSWTADHLTQWYDQPSVTFSQDEQEIAASLLWILKGDAVQRSVVGWHFGWTPALQVSGRHWQAPLLAQQLDDSYSAVRFVAESSLKRLPGFEQFRYDYTGPRSEQTAAKERAINLWQSIRQLDDLPTDKKTLLNLDGSLMSAEIERLLRQQDTTPLQLAE
ncbi:MAG TPA: hypothetical protein EYG57_13405 [Planctomycetes bacterium]|nr:hypothetical protein [Planctomycetaceae bacterium]HIM30530.1 hypothetical protein [Planctomycetota bacterium]